MAQLQVTKGLTKKLPTNQGQVFTAGLGWDPAQGQSDVDLDLWILRKKADGTVEAAYWGNRDWHRPDLGTNSEGNPWIVSPEGDITHKGDDRSGKVAETGYDETAVLDLSKAPAEVVQYAIFTTYYDEKTPSDTLGMATNIVCGVTEDNSGNELVSKVEDDHGFDVSLLVCTIDRAETGWTMTNKDEGFTDDMVTVARKAGVKF
jgi:stress response protein SCP2